jgi:hypothetical protein
VWLTEVRLEKGKSYQITGSAESSALATQFVERLRTTGAWGEARLDLAKAVDTTDQNTVSFVVGGRLNSTGNSKATK